MTDIVERLRELAAVIPDGATNPSDANTLKETILEIAQLRSDLEYARKRAEKAEAALERTSSPVWDGRNDYEGPGQAPYHPPECGGFQGFED